MSERIHLKQDRAPLNPDVTDSEFQRVQGEIEDSIEEHQLMISPEQFWSEFKTAIQFIPFEKYLALIDKVIADHQGELEIVCFYHHQEPYSDQGPINHSEQFMIRLLKEVIKRRNLNITVRVFDAKNSSGSRPQQSILMDDAMYTGDLKEYDIRTIGNRVQVSLYAVATTQKALEKLKRVMSARTEQSSKIVYIQKLRKANECLSAQAQVIFKDLYAHQVMSSDQRPSEYQNDDEWKVGLVGQAEYLLERPLAFNPFKLPDMTSTFTNLLQNVVPLTNVGSYIDPGHLLSAENDDSLALHAYKTHEVRVSDPDEEHSKMPKLIKSMVNIFRKDS